MKKTLIAKNKKWDWKSIRNTFIIICVLGVIFWRIGIGATNDYERQLDKLDSITDGKIVNVKNFEYMSQGRDGNTTQSMGYEVTFVYSVNNITYTNTIFIKSTQGQYKEIISHYYRDGERDFKIKYEGNDPHQSLIDF